MRVFSVFTDQCDNDAVDHVARSLWERRDQSGDCPGALVYHSAATGAVEVVLLSAEETADVGADDAERALRSIFSIVLREEAASGSCVGGRCVW